MRHFFLLSSFLLLFSLPSPSLAGWDGGDRAPVGAAESGYRWERSSADPDCWGLRLNGIQVGAWRQSTNDYRPLVGGSGWGNTATPPVGLPARPTVPVAVSPKGDYCKCCGEQCDCAFKPCGKPDCKCVLPGAVVESDGTLNFGLSRKEFAPKRIHNGREVDRQQIISAIKANVPNDAAEMCVTVIGQDAERKPVLADLSSAPALAPFKGKLKIQGYAPDHWAVKDSGFVTTGHPTIYFQAADGKVVHRQDEYRGADALAEALRGADPSYKPGLDPDLNKALAGLPSFGEVGKWVESVPPYVWLALALFLYLRFGHREGVK